MMDITKGEKMKTSSKKLKVFVVILLVLSTILVAGALIFMTTTERGQNWSEEFKKNVPEVPRVEVEIPSLETSSRSKTYEVQLDEIQNQYAVDVPEGYTIYSGEDVEKHMNYSKNILEGHIEKSRERLEHILESHK